ncbi:hypothetical protein BSLG_000853 [Batrachochytrium salamandrivorans]|nr:hypothetical protein BSLG_000853 [Batrachochytrium salamandrivorans]
MLALTKHLHGQTATRTGFDNIPENIYQEKLPLPSSKRTIKQGWILKKAGSGVFAKWRKKFLVLSLDTTRTGLKGQDARYVLFLYEDRDMSKPPKHEIEVSDLRIDSTGNGAGLGSSVSSGLKKHTAPFIIYSNKRKVCHIYDIKLGFFWSTFVFGYAWGYSPSKKCSLRLVALSRETPLLSAIWQRHLLKASSVEMVLPRSSGSNRSRRVARTVDKAILKSPSGRAQTQNVASQDQQRMPQGITRSETVQSMRTPRLRSARSGPQAQNHTDNQGGATCTLPLSRSNSRYAMSSRSRSVTGSSYIDDSDARSVYSTAESEYYQDDDNDDAASIVSGVSGISGVSRSTVNASRYNRTDEDICSFTSSRVETLSFNSEPVLTPYELTLMGDPNSFSGSSIPEPLPVQSKDNLRKRKAPMQLVSTNPNYSKQSWNEKYQAQLSIRVITLEAALHRDVQIMDLIGNFRQIAGEHACKIVDKLHLQSENRSLENSIMEHDGIFFQFACNYDVCSPEEVHMALSRSSRELKGIDAALQASCRAGDGGLPVLRTILMALVDYKGFRIIAHADIGGLDHMLPIHDLHPEHPILDETASGCMVAIGRELNLKQHAVQVNADRRVQVPLSATAEVHLDQRSNTMYLTSLHEIFPIDHYVEDDQSRMTDLAQGVKTMALCHQGHLDHGDNLSSINYSHRLRPEFLDVYQTSLCADGLTPTSGSSRREIEDNNAQVARASRFLRETWIPGFVRTLDNLDARPFDSLSMTGEMHRNGVNVRYLGMVCSLSTIPFIRNLALTEMVARILKSILRDRIRSAILHFKSVGATQIDDQMRSYVTSMFNSALGNSERSQRYFEDRIRGAVEAKFSYQIGYRQFCSLHRPALFLAMQHHCGVEFINTMDYDFDTSFPIQQGSFKSFAVNIKTLSGLSQIKSAANSRLFSSSGLGSTASNSSNYENGNGANVSYNSHRNNIGCSLREDERLAYLLARHFKGIGPKAKLNPCNASAAALAQIASHYNATSRFEEARLYAQAAVSSSLGNHIIYALASAQLLYSLAGLQTNAMGAPDTTLLAIYRNALSVAEWHWGSEAPLALCLHDRMSGIYQRVQNSQKALEFARQSLDISEKSLGKNHAHTAAYLTKTACFLKDTSQIDEAIDRLTQATHIYQSLRTDPSHIAEVHFYMADCFAERGDVDSAIQHAQTSRRLRERMFGFSDIRVIESCCQVATMVLAPYVDYKGVLTPQIRQAYRDAIGCHEKVFRKGCNSSSQIISRQQTLVDPMVTADSGAVMALDSGNSYAVSQVSNSSSSGPSLAGSSYINFSMASPHSATMTVRTSNLLGTCGSPYPISGPLITSPYGWSHPLGKSSLHKLTKDIMTLRLALLESPRHRECVRMLRAQRLASIDAANAGGEYPSRMVGQPHQRYLGLDDRGNAAIRDGYMGRGLDADEARGVIQRLAAVSPSVYLDGILQRIDDEDNSAVEELRVVLMLTESETVGLTS